MRLRNSPPKAGSAVPWTPGANNQGSKITRSGPSHRVPPCLAAFTALPRQPFSAIAKAFAAVHQKISISHVVHTQWCTQEVESKALSKFEPPTILGDSQDFEKTIRKAMGSMFERPWAVCSKDDGQNVRKAIGCARPSVGPYTDHAHNGPSLQWIII